MTCEHTFELAVHSWHKLNSCKWTRLWGERGTWCTDGSELSRAWLSSRNGWGICVARMMCRTWNLGELELWCGMRALWGGRIGLCSVGMAYGWICLELDVTMWEKPLTCLEDVWNEDFLKLCSSMVQQTWWSLEIWPTNGQTLVEECRWMCYPVLLDNLPFVFSSLSRTIITQMWPRQLLSWTSPCLKWRMTYQGSWSSQLLR